MNNPEKAPRKGSGQASAIPHPATCKWLITGLLVLVAAQAFWIFNPAPAPTLSNVIKTTPIGEHSAVYEVLSNSGGATVPLVYRYFIADREPDEVRALKMLKAHTPFLVTRQSDAIRAVEGLKITALTHARVYAFSNSALLRENGEIQPVTIDLSATSD
ncbi:hypothetical protein [Pseudomonas sp. zfem002]|uniref:hypothetical protein n=1 Tax=Pseudomonas sp. zfem002 TaxID=3078197 RepID=UPI0029282163|nr:hypothetical protein [Pseudomonas sp. zfem002]MDU9392547.1 hypothetical protein [Pseudomonas sp. zfem002]